VGGGGAQSESKRVLLLWQGVRSSIGALLCSVTSSGPEFRLSRLEYPVFSNWPEHCPRSPVSTP